MSKALFLSALLSIPAGRASAQFIAEAEFSGGYMGGTYLYGTVTQGDGKVVVVGDFDTVESTTRNNIARLLPDSSLDTTFDPDADGRVKLAIVQDDDKILIAGDFTTVDVTSCDGFARLNRDGSVDTSFAPTFDGSVVAAALQTDGKILVGGYFTTVNGFGRNYIARLNSDGSLDTGFNPNANGPMRLLSLRSDGKILAIGGFGTIGGGTRAGFARLNTNGTLDTTFTHGGSTASYIMTCPLVGSDGSMVYALSSGSYSNVEEVADDGTYVGTIVDMSSTDNIFNSLVGSKTSFYTASSSNGGIYHSSGGWVSYTGMPTGHISQLAKGGFLYASTGAPGFVGQHQVANPPVTTETLTYVSGTTLRWTQSSAFFATFDYTKFQHSTDGGATWSDLGFGTKVSSTQIELTVSLPGSGLIRAVGGTRAGQGSMSRSLLGSKVVTIAPEIEVTGNNLLISDGDTTPSTTDFTDFGNTTVSSGSSMRTYKVGNLGINLLTISSISVSGAHAADFSVSSLSGVNGQTSGNLNVTFDPSALGTRTATITIASDDADEGSYEFDIQGTGIEPEINVKGNSTSIADGDSTPSSGDHTDFGNVAWNSSLMRTFTIENTSSYPLSVSSITRTGDTANFTLSGSVGTVAASSSATFNVTFIPNGLGSKSATITILSNDGDEGSYDFVVQGVGVEPEINLTGNSVNIVDGDATPSATDHTDFGTPSVGGSVVRTFTVQNTGGSSLTVSSINVTGHSADFTVGGISLPAVVAASGSTTFTVTYAPLTAGLRSATVTLGNNDVNESSYDFAIQGTSSPEINLLGGATSIADGDTTPSLLDGTNFGVAIASAEQVVTTFTIQNLGTGPLSISSISKSGTHNGDYTIGSYASSVPSGGTANFDVTFTPSAIGTRTATITVTNSDANESSYDYAVQGRGVQAGDADTGFTNPHIHNNLVNAVAVQPDGKVIVAGTFTHITNSPTNIPMGRVARFNVDGTLDTSFADPNVNNTVHCVAVQPDGEILIGGEFTTVGGIGRTRIARLNADGSLDSYNPGATGIVYSIQQQPDGKVIVTGAFNGAASIAGQARNRVARLDSSGAADSFNPNAGGTSVAVHGSVTQADGKVILYGTFTSMGGNTSFIRMARVDSSGALDTGYDPNLNSTVNCAQLQSDGKLMVGGIFTGTNATRIARIETSGSVNSSFIGTANAEVHSFALQADARLFVSGALTSLSGTLMDYTGRVVASDGDDDATFVNPDANGIVYGAALQADGKLLLGGAFITVDGGVSQKRLARFENHVGTEALAVTSSSRVEWLRGGGAPEASFVLFEVSTDSGTTWTPLGAGTRISGGWEITGLSLPGSGQIRASAYISSGRRNGSQGIVQSTVVF